MIDLSDSCGLNIYFDEETGEVRYGDNVKCTFQKHIGLKEIIPILLNKFLKYPENVYNHYVNVSDINHNNSISHDIFHLPSGLLGIEYLKTHVYKSDFEEGKHACIVEVNKGTLTVVIQKNDEENQDIFSPTNVKDVKIIELIAGDRFAIPSGTLYTFINTSSDQVVFVVIAKNLSQLDYTKHLIKEKGLSYFIISKNARLEIVANPKYKIQKPVEKYNWHEMNDELKEEFVNDFTKDQSPAYNLLAGNQAALAGALV